MVPEGLDTLGLFLLRLLLLVFSSDGLFCRRFLGVAVFCVAAARCQLLNYESSNTLVINAIPGFSTRYPSKH